LPGYPVAGEGTNRGKTRSGVIRAPFIVLAGATPREAGSMARFRRRVWRC